MKNVRVGSEDNAKASQNRKSTIAVCLLTAMVAMAVYWVLSKPTNDKRENEGLIVEMKKQFFEKEKEKKIIDREVEDVSNLLHQYLSAPTVEEKFSYIYNADDHKDKIREYYNENGGVKPLEDYFIYLVLPTHIDGEEIWEVTVKKNQEGIDNISSYYVRKDSDDEFKVDWFSDVALQENDILEFKKSRSNRPTKFKFQVKKLNDKPTYNWGFRDTEYEVVKLTEPNTNLVFWGYLKIGSSAHTSMNRYLGMDLKNRIVDVEFIHQFILVVKFLKDSPRENDQYIVIEDVISRRWFTPSVRSNNDQ